MWNSAMLAKKTAKNQITLPKAVIAHFPDVTHFDVSEENGRIVMVPVRPYDSALVRDKLAELGVSESDVDDAIAWARNR